MYKRTWKNPANDIVHIVAMPGGPRPFSACGTYTFAFKEPDNYFRPGVATCVACWAREFLEWEREANAPAPRKGI